MHKTVKFNKSCLKSHEVRLQNTLHSSFSRMSTINIQGAFQVASVVKNPPGNAGDIRDAGKVS